MWRVRCAVHTSRRLQQTAVSCKRSNCNQKKFAKCHFWAAWWWSCTTGRPVLYAALSRAQMRFDLFFIFMSSTRNRSTATKMCWMKKTTGAISDTGREESVKVALLQTLGEDGATWSTLRWSLNDLSSVQFFQMYWERSTNSLFRKYSSSVILQVKSFCASLSIWMHTSSVRSMLSSDSRNVELFWKRSWFPLKPFLMHLFLKLWAIKCFPFVLQSSHDDCHGVALS